MELNPQVFDRAQDILSRRGLKKCVEFLVEETRTTTDTLAMIQAEDWLLGQATPTGPKDLATLDLFAGNLFTAQDNARRRIGEAMRHPEDSSHQMDWLDLYAQVFPEVFHACLTDFLIASTWDRQQWGERMNALVRQHWADAARLAAYEPVSPRSTAQSDEGKLVCLTLAWAKAGAPDNLTVEDWTAFEHLAGRLMPLTVLDRFTPLVDELRLTGRQRILGEVAGEHEERAKPPTLRM